jgi:hypothetical protein
MCLQGTPGWYTAAGQLQAVGVVVWYTSPFLLLISCAPSNGIAAGKGLCALPLPAQKGFHGLGALRFLAYTLEEYSSRHLNSPTPL